jgi:hypothetical protein
MLPSPKIPEFKIPSIPFPPLPSLPGMPNLLGGLFEFKMEKIDPKIRMVYKLEFENIDMKEL